MRIETPGKDTIHLALTQKAVTKGDLAFWDIITSNKGKRPVCFTAWIDAQEHGLKNNLICDGLVYRLTDQKTDSNSILNEGKIETEGLYTKLMKKCNWDNLANPAINFDWHHRRMLASMQIRTSFYRLANQLTKEHQAAKALEVLQKADQTISLMLWPVDYQTILMAGLYTSNGQKQTGEKRFRQLATSLEEQLRYYSGFDLSQKKSISSEVSYQLSLYNELIKQAADTLPETELKNMKEKLMQFAEQLG